MPARITVVGSANVDLVFRTPRFPAPGETVLGTSFATVPGGKGANQAVAAAKLGGDVQFVCCLGDDPFGSLLLDSLEGAGVDCRSVRRLPDVPTGAANIVIDASGQNQIVVAPGANWKLSAEHVRTALLGAEVVLCQLEVPDEAVEEASRAPRFILNPAPARDLSDGLLSRCLAVVPNETETERLTGITPSDLESCHRASRVLLDKEVGNVVLTLGERGCFWCSPSGDLHLPAEEVEPIDTVAAGDAFCGALALRYAETGDWKESLGFANRAAAIAVTRLGAHESMPFRDDLTRRSAF